MVIDFEYWSRYDSGMSPSPLISSLVKVELSIWRVKQDLPLPGGANLAVLRRGRICLADSENYSIVDLEAAEALPLLPISQVRRLSLNAHLFSQFRTLIFALMYRLLIPIFIHVPHLPLPLLMRERNLLHPISTLVKNLRSFLSDSTSS